MAAFGIGERRACKATGFNRSSQRYRRRCDEQIALRMRLRELAASRVRYGYRRLHILLKREGWAVNHKRTYRLYREEGLSIRSKVPKRKRAWRYREGRPQIGEPNQVWAMDFVSDRLFDERPFRVLTVVDCADCHHRHAVRARPRFSAAVRDGLDFKGLGKSRPFGWSLSGRDCVIPSEFRYGQRGVGLTAFVVRRLAKSSGFWACPRRQGPHHHCD